MKHVALAAFAGALACCAVTVSSASRTRLGCRQPRHNVTGLESCRSRALRLRLPLLPSIVLAWLPSSLVVVIKLGGAS